jgi:iron complex outermembrane recepter protein
MKPTLPLLIVLFSLFSLIAQAQNKGTRINGSVIDGSSKTIESATIALHTAKDSSVLKFAVADKTGKYSFPDVVTGNYFISVTAVGHDKGFSEPIIVDGNTSEINLKTIELVPQAKSIAGVTITARRPLIEQKIDRTVVNVEASVTNVGATAMEVLEKSPGLSVDKDGNISLKGKQGVMVLIDGRPTQLGGADLANLLRSMSANQLDQIEIMTNAPAKYDAAGNAGVINIKTKKNKQFGYNGALTLGYGQGKYPKFNEGLNFNYRHGKINLFTNLSHNYRKGFSELEIQRNFRDRNSKQLISTFDQFANMQNINETFNGKIGADYFASKNTTFGVVVSGLTSPGTFTNRNLNNIYDVTGKLLSETRAISQQESRWNNFSTNFNFRQVLDTTGKEITADLDYLTYGRSSSQTLSNSYFDAAGNSISKSDTLYSSMPQDINIYSGRIDYLQPLKNGARFEAGVKSSIVRTDNNAIYDTVHNGEIIRDLNRSNHFIYEENINAAYVNLNKSLSKKLSAQLGLRLENTIAKGKQISTNEEFDRNYTQLFPTAFLQYKANEKNTIGLNYGRRIRRPNYESLNPFIEYLDRYTSQQGNPNLKPQFSHNIEASHSFKGFLTTTLNYTNTTDIIQQVIEQNETTNEAYVKQQNIAQQRQYGLSVSANMPVTKWWRNSLYVNAFNNRFEGIVNNAPITISATSVMVNGTQTFTLNKTLSAELSGWYRTAGIEGVIKIRPMGMMSAGVSQQVLKGKGTVRLNVRDIFYTQQFKAVSKYGNVDAAFQNRNDSRVVNVGFTYRFSKGKINGGAKRRTGSANDEQNRVGVSN